MTVASPEVLEIFGGCGLDAALIDLQHVSYGVAESVAMITAAELAGVTPLVRPSRVDRSEVTRLLDAGAYGIVFPEIEDREMASEAVRMLRFPPRGTRGWGGAHTRFAGWQGGTAYLELRSSAESDVAVHNRSFLARAEDSLACVVIVESVQGVNNIDAIASVDGIDAIIFGWGDYSVEVGFDLAKSEDAARTVYEACRARGIGVALPSNDSGVASFYPGCFSIIGVDSLMLSAAARKQAFDARKVWSSLDQSGKGGGGH